MKTTCVKMRRLATALVVVVIGGGLVAAATYYEVERKIRAQEAFTKTVQALCQEQKLNMALQSVRGGDVERAAWLLDSLLCGSICRLNSDLASADAETQTFVAETRQRMALGLRGMAGGEAAGSGKQRREDPAAADRTLRGALSAAGVNRDQ
jgi:hypothetical protein